MTPDLTTAFPEAGEVCTETPVKTAVRAASVFFKAELDNEAKLKLLSVFQSGRPVEIEIGCGKGKFIIGHAMRFPETYLIAIDRVGKWMQIGRERAEKRNLDNLFFLKVEGRSFLRDYVPTESVKAFHIYFPDPWPKRRQRKRRMLNAFFLKLLYDKLCPGGLVYIATDDNDYFNAIKEAADGSNLRWRMLESKNRRLNGDEAIKTNYETRFELAGKELYYLELKKL